MTHKFTWVKGERVGKTFDLHDGDEVWNAGCCACSGPGVRMAALVGAYGVRCAGCGTLVARAVEPRPARGPGCVGPEGKAHRFVRLRAKVDGERFACLDCDLHAPAEALESMPVSWVMADATRAPAEYDRGVAWSPERVSQALVPRCGKLRRLTDHSLGCRCYTCRVEECSPCGEKAGHDGACSPRVWLDPCPALRCQTGEPGCALVTPCLCHGFGLPAVTVQGATDEAVKAFPVPALPGGLRYPPPGGKPAAASPWGFWRLWEAGAPADPNEAARILRLCVASGCMPPGTVDAAARDAANMRAYWGRRQLEALENSAHASAKIAAIDAALADTRAPKGGSP